MGCDIHAHLEVKMDGKWEHYSAPDVKRNYKLFSKMAGVRQDKDWPTEPIAEIRGLPNDLSVVTEVDFCKWMQDAHSASWLNLEEIVAVECWAEVAFTLNRSEFVGYLFGNDIGEFMLDTQMREELGVEDVRLVFWFDN